MASTTNQDDTASDSASDSEAWLGRIDCSVLAEDDAAALAARVARPAARGWAPGFHEQIDGGATEFEFAFDRHAPAAVRVGLAWREQGTASTVWDAALVMLGWFDHDAAAFPEGWWRSRRVVELGAGTGVVGLGAATLGAAAVALTDLPGALPALEANIARCGGAASATARALPLSWGDDGPDAAAFDGACDVVLCADVLLPYAKHLFGPLAASLARLLARGSKAGDEAAKAAGPAPHRPVAFFAYERRFDVSSFFEMLESKHNIQVEVVARARQHPAYRAPEIELLRCVMAKHELPMPPPLPAPQG